jgi:hypothetical protein
MPKYQKIKRQSVVFNGYGRARLSADCRSDRGENQSRLILQNAKSANKMAVCDTIRLPNRRNLCESRINA